MVFQKRLQVSVSSRNESVFLYISDIQTRMASRRDLIHSNTSMTNPDVPVTTPATVLRNRFVSKSVLQHFILLLIKDKKMLSKL